MPVAIGAENYWKGQDDWQKSRLLDEENERAGQRVEIDQGYLGFRRDADSREQAIHSKRISEWNKNEELRAKQRQAEAAKAELGAYDSRTSLEDRQTGRRAFGAATGGATPGKAKGMTAGNEYMRQLRQQFAQSIQGAFEGAGTAQDLAALVQAALDRTEADEGFRVGVSKRDPNKISVFVPAERSATGEPVAVNMSVDQFKTWLSAGADPESYAKMQEQAAKDRAAFRRTARAAEATQYAADQRRGAVDDAAVFETRKRILKELKDFVSTGKGLFSARSQDILAQIESGAGPSAAQTDVLIQDIELLASSPEPSVARDTAHDMLTALRTWRRLLLGDGASGPQREIEKFLDENGGSVAGAEPERPTRSAFPANRNVLELNLDNIGGLGRMQRNPQGDVEPVARRYAQARGMDEAAVASLLANGAIRVDPRRGLVSNIVSMSVEDLLRMPLAAGTPAPIRPVPGQSSGHP